MIIAGTIPSHCNIPPTNPTVPSAPASFTVTPLLGTLQFDIGAPVVRPLSTRYQILASPGTLAVTGSYSVIWEGLLSRVTLPADLRSYYWYHARAVTNSWYSVTQPNTFGLGAKPWITPESMPGNRTYPDGELYFANNSYWTSANLRTAHSYFLVTSGGLHNAERGRLIIVCDSDNWSNGGGPFPYSRITPMRYDVNSRGSFIAAPMMPGQSGTFMAIYRRATNITAGAFPSISARVAPLTVNSPKSLNFGSALASVSISAVSAASGDWNVAVGSFTMPTSNAYSGAVLAVTLNDAAQAAGTLEIAALQLSTL